MATDTRNLSPDAQEAIRLRVVQAVVDGMSYVAAAKAFGVHRNMVSIWHKSFLAQGWDALKARKRGRSQGSGKLNAQQAGQIYKLLVDKHPDQLKLPFALWTREAVQRLVKRLFQVELSLSSVGRYLRRWGFTPQKPRRRAYEQDPEAARRWEQEQYPAIRAQAKAEKAVIYWGDEMGLRSDHQTGRSWALKGHTPVVAGTGQRFSCNVISAITNRGHLGFMVFKERFTAPVFIRFLRKLIKQAARRVYLIVDNHPVHRSRLVREWVAGHRHKIKLFFLPGYSPELNPDEMLNNDVKSNAVGRKRAGNKAQLMANVRRHLTKRQQDRDTVRRYFHAPTVRYALR